MGPAQQRATGWALLTVLVGGAARICLAPLAWLVQRILVRPRLSFFIHR
jgi:hypothetical protein